MFPTNLQKSIRELDRQISLLETECENMEFEKKEISIPFKNSSKLLTKESSYKPFITGPCVSSSSCATKRSSFSEVAPKIYSGSGSHFTKLSGHSLEESKDGLKKLNDVDPANTRMRESKFQESHKKFIGSKRDYSPGKEIYPKSIISISGIKQESMFHSKTQNPIDRDIHNESKRSISSIKEMSETSDDNREVCSLSCKRKNLDTIQKEQMWVNNVDPKVWDERWSERKDESTDEANERPHHQPQMKKPSSEGGDRRQCSTCSVMDRPSSEKRSLEREINSTPRNKIFTKRRSRSVRTKKHNIYEGIDISKTLEEKETQCMLFTEESEKTEFLADVNNSIKTLQLLIGELKAKSSEERKRNVLNDMQKTLEKISSFKSINAINNPLNTLAYLKGNLTVLEKDDSVTDLKKILLGVKLYCQELSDEKQALSQKLSTKNRTIESLKNNEKEYLSLISSLKYNLEKLKEEAEEGARAAKDLKIVKNKLQEETKVIEALKKSHGKMQDLIENYVLENDKLRAQVKMAKLESQKFTILLSGKEAEIYKYKKEIESFQRQITEQLKLLRSKASDNQVVHTIDVIRKQSIFHTEIDSCPSETTFEKEFNENSFADSKSLESVSTDTRNESKYKEKTLFTVPRVQIEPQSESGKHSDQIKEPGDSIKDAGFTSCKSDGSEPSEHEQKCYSRRKKLNSEKQNSIQEMLEDMRINSSKNFWPLTQNSSNTTHCTSISNASENEIKQSQV